MTSFCALTADGNYGKFNFVSTTSLTVFVLVLSWLGNASSTMFSILTVFLLSITNKIIKKSSPDFLLLYYSLGILMGGGHESTFCSPIQKNLVTVPSSCLYVHESGRFFHNTSRLYFFPLCTACILFVHVPAVFSFSLGFAFICPWLVLLRCLSF